MINKYLLYVEIPNYITHVKLSNRRRAKYYTTKSKIPKKYKNYRFNTENFLIDKLGNKIISNPKVVGTPNMKKINGQDFYRGGNNPIIRSKIVLKMKSFWTDKLKKCKKININQYPLKLSLDFYVPENENFDVDNMGWVYVKTIQDSLVKLKIIEEDTNKIITNTGECQYIPIPINKNRKLIIKIESNKKKLLNLLKNENRYKNR